MIRIYTLLPTDQLEGIDTLRYLPTCTNTSLETVSHDGRQHTLLTKFAMKSGSAYFSYIYSNEQRVKHFLVDR